MSLKKTQKRFLLENKKKNLNFFLFYFKTQKFLVLEKNKNNFINYNSLFYHSIPNSVSIKQAQNNFFFENRKNIGFQNSFNSFQNSVTTTIKNFNKTFKKKLFLKGLGMRIFYKTKLHLLKLKLGFSSLINIDVPLGIKIFINKNTLILESSNSVLVGNFAHTIYSLKLPNIYTGKGFCFKNQQLKLKVVKKA